MKYHWTALITTVFLLLACLELGQSITMLDTEHTLNITFVNPVGEIPTAKSIFWDPEIMHYHLTPTRNGLVYCNNYSRTHESLATWDNLSHQVTWLVWLLCTGLPYWYSGAFFPSSSRGVVVTIADFIPWIFTLCMSHSIELNKN